MGGRIPLTTIDPYLAHPDCRSNEGETPRIRAALPQPSENITYLTSIARLLL
jgi:hypothetical protein